MVIDKDFIAKIHVYPHRFSTEPNFLITLQLELNLTEISPFQVSLPDIKVKASAVPERYIYLFFLDTVELQK